jgi:hypothetical protein
MKMKKPWPTFLGLLLLAVPAPVQAGFYDGFYYSTNGQSITITGCSFPNGGNVFIPSSIEGLPVTSIAAGAFSGQLSSGGFSDVTIPGTVTNIGDYAFYECSGITNVTIAGSVKSIGNYAFYNCVQLLTVTLSSGTASIGSWAFAACGRFSGGIFIPSSITNIGDAAFSLDPSTITVDAQNLFYTSINGVLYNKSQTAIIQAWGGASAIPGSVASILDYAFWDRYVGSLMILPVGLTNIGAGAFERGPNNVTGPNSFIIFGGVTNIPTYAFSGFTGGSFYFTGDAPSFDSNAFAFASDCTIYYLPGTTGWSSPLASLPAVLWNVTWPVITNEPVSQTIDPGSNVTLHVGALGAKKLAYQWFFDGVKLTNGSHVSGATSNLLTLKNIAISNAGSYEVIVTNSYGSATSTIATVSLPPSGTLVFVTNGYGTIKHGVWPDQLVVGENYTVTAMPQADNLFSNWTGGTTTPYSVLSTSSNYTFAMQSNLVVEANFVTNVFLAAQGTYRGLFAPASSSGQRGGYSGSFLLSVTSGGLASGSLTLGNQSFSISGAFDIAGAAVMGPQNQSAIEAVGMQLDFSSQTVNGTVGYGPFLASLLGDRDVFSTAKPASDFESQYTLIIAGTNNPSAGPFGVSYATVKVDALGNITMTGSLADGTSISQTSVVSKDGYWPFYVSLYGGNGSLWGWNQFTNRIIQTAVRSDTPSLGLSWNNFGNSSARALYGSGFTNQEARLTGGLYVPTSTLPDALNATLIGGNLPFGITNQVAISSSDVIALQNPLDETNKLELTVTKSTGLISGSFANPANPKQTIKVNGVILQGQTNAQGYFLGVSQSGTFRLAPP